MVKHLGIGHRFHRVGESYNFCARSGGINIEFHDLRSFGIGKGILSVYLQVDIRCAGEHGHSPGNHHRRSTIGGYSVDICPGTIHGFSPSCGHGIDLKRVVDHYVDVSIEMGIGLSKGIFI